MSGSAGGAASWPDVSALALPRARKGKRLVRFIAAFDLPRQPFEALIEGVEMDLGNRRYETFPDLYEHFRIRVASAVGLICLNIFGARDPGARQYAIELGASRSS